MPLWTWLLRSKVERLDRKLRRLHAEQRDLRKKGDDPAAKRALQSLTEDVHKTQAAYDAAKAALDKATAEAASA